ncbi:hypothetical protein RRG08_011160 [Elysia crispata]|uniref:Uncharacterized protein n=1 Tax=Elysia crispata TaxID=231223 RepID=A0AAE1A1C4_9GAST|nr:hypothetical protein RRG08_011160 [Elysia crispata]
MITAGKDDGLPMGYPLAAVRARNPPIVDQELLTLERANTGVDPRGENPFHLARKILNPLSALLGVSFTPVC